MVTYSCRRNLCRILSATSTLCATDAEAGQAAVYNLIGTLVRRASESVRCEDVMSVLFGKLAKNIKECEEPCCSNQDWLI